MSVHVHLLHSGNLRQAHPDCWILGPAGYIQIQFSYSDVLSDCCADSGDENLYFQSLLCSLKWVLPAALFLSFSLK